MTRATRLGRGALAAAVSLFLAAFSHGVAGGDAPGLVGLALSSIVALAASVALIGRRITVGRSVLAVGIGQVVFHLLFSVGAAGSVVAHVGGSGHHASVVFEPVAAGVGGDAHAHTDLPMLAGHVAAGIATVVYLVAFEAALWRAARATGALVASRAADLGCLVRALLVAARESAQPAGRALVARFRLVVSSDVARLTSRLLETRLRVRGPPLVAVSA